MRQGSRRTLATAALLAAACAVPVAGAGAEGQPPSSLAQAAPTGHATVGGITVTRDRRHATVRLSCPAEGGAGCVVAVTGNAAGHALNTGGGGGASRVYYGAMVDGRPPTATSFEPGGAFHEFERVAGKRLSLVHWGQPWVMNGQPLAFPTAYMDNVRRHGSIPVLNWASWALGKGAEQPRYQLRDITAGRHDAYIESFARQAAAWGHPFMLRFNHEMNGWWYPWGVGKGPDGRRVNGNRPEDFVRAWRHVHRVFDRVGAHNVTWAWTPNIQSRLKRYPKLRKVYPGNRYVDWTGLSGYNRDASWLGPNQLFTGRGTRFLTNSYATIRSFAPHRPMMLAETGSVEARDGGARKARWIRELLNRQVPHKLQGVKAVMWFNWDIEPWPTMRIDSSRAAATAFSRAIASPIYASNQYSGLITSPIPDPRRLERRVKWLELQPGSSARLRVWIPSKAARRLQRQGGEVRFTARTLDSALPPATRSAYIDGS